MYNIFARICEGSITKCLCKYFVNYKLACKLLVMNLFSHFMRWLRQTFLSSLKRRDLSIASTVCVLLYDFFLCGKSGAAGSLTLGLLPGPLCMRVSYDLWVGSCVGKSTFQEQRPINEGQSRGVNTLASFLFVRQFWAEFCTDSQRIGGGVRGWTEPQLPRAVNHLLTLPFLSHFSNGSQCFLRSPHGHHLK